MTITHNSNNTFKAVQLCNLNAQLDEELKDYRNYDNVGAITCTYKIHNRSPSSHDFPIYAKFITLDQVIYFGYKLPMLRA